MSIGKWGQKLNEVASCLGVMADCLASINYCNPITSLTMPDSCGTDCVEKFRINNWFDGPQVVGRWINGKPLYREIVGADTKFTAISATWLDMFSLPSDIDEIIYYTHYDNPSPSGGLGDLEYYLQGTNAHRFSRSTFQFYSAINTTYTISKSFVIWYTKTTDSISSGSSTFPSLSEILVGSLRGVNLYAKVYLLSNLPATYDDTNKNPAILSLDPSVDTIIDSRIILTDGTYFHKLGERQLASYTASHDYKLQLLGYYFKDNILHFSAQEVVRTSVTFKTYNNCTYPYGTSGYLFLLYTKSPLLPVDLDTPELVGYWKTTRPIYKVNATHSYTIQTGHPLATMIVNAPKRLKLIGSWLSCRIDGYTTNLDSGMGLFTNTFIKYSPPWFYLPTLERPQIMPTNYPGQIPIFPYGTSNKDFNGKTLVADATIFYTTTESAYGCI